MARALAGWGRVSLAFPLALLAGCAEDKAEPGEEEDTAGLSEDSGGEDTAPDTDCPDPTAEVPYDGLDNDCDPATPDDDLDADGFAQAEDCDDADAALNPDAAEVCDGLDNDCDGATDPADAADAAAWYADADQDGYGVDATPVTACAAPEGTAAEAGDCDDDDPAVSPAGTEICNSVDDNCDGSEDEDLECPVGGYGGHRIDKDGSYYYALYSDPGFGIMGTSDWFGKNDATGAPEGITWSEDQSVLYYNDLAGNVFAQAEPFTSSSTLVGSFAMYQVGGGVILDGYYYVGDYYDGNIHRMDVATGAVSLYASLGSTACKPYFGNSAMSIDADGTVYAASSCGVVAYSPGVDAVMLNSYPGLISAVAMDADNELYSLDTSGNIVHFDKVSGAVLGSVKTAATPSGSWTMAIDENGDVIVSYWGEQRIFSGVDGSIVHTFSGSAYYPGTTGYYWYVTF